MFNTVTDYFTVAILSYLIGSIPFGALITRALGMGDVRQIGSGNIGATNVLRTGNKGAAAATLVLDMLKGFVAVTICNFYAPALSGLSLVFVILGHCFPVWLKFKGGKGVAAYIGAVFGLFWVLGTSAVCVWLIIAITRKISSLASLVMVLMTIVFGLFFTPGYIWSLVVAAIIIIYQHRGNIERLRDGTEPRIGQK